VRDLARSLKAGDPRLGVLRPVPRLHQVLGSNFALDRRLGLTIQEVIMEDAVKPSSRILDRASAPAFREIAEEYLLHRVGRTILLAQYQGGESMQLPDVGGVQRRNLAFEFCVRNGLPARFHGSNRTGPVLEQKSLPQIAVRFHTYPSKELRRRHKEVLDSIRLN